MFDANYAKALTELADLRAKLAAAEEHGEQYRKNWKSLQDLTGEECLDRARYAVKVWKEAAEQLAAAREREAGLMSLVERLREGIKLIRDRAKPIGLDRGDSVTFYMAEGALSLTPPAALDDLRRREREAALLEAADVIEAKASGEQMTGAFAAKYLRDRADAIAAERAGEGGAA